MPARISIRTFTLQRLSVLRVVAGCSAVLLFTMVCLLSSAGSVQASTTSGESTPVPFDIVLGHTFSLQGQVEPAPPNPLIYLDIWLFGGLILLVALIVTIKYLWKAFQPDDRDPSEGLQPWERPDYDDEK